MTQQTLAFDQQQELSRCTSKARLRSPCRSCAPLAPATNITRTTCGATCKNESSALLILRAAFCRPWRAKGAGRWNASIERGRGSR